MTNPRAAATRAAEDSGQPVVVEPETTETTQVEALPDGTYRLLTSTQPVRVLRDDSWTPVDPTLELKPDGSIGPRNTAIDVTFSAGGDEPFTTLTDDQDRSLSLEWPGPLPVPVLHENTATYPEVLPGVDLQVAATATGYQQALVVKNAEAARNPALQSTELTLRGSGLTLSAGSDGGLDAVDAAGTTVFGGATPVMWDGDSNPKVGGRPTATDPGGSAVEELDHTIAPAAPEPGDTSAVTLTLQPDPAQLTGPDVTYPVFIDPSYTANNPVDYGFVFSNGWKSYNNASQDLKVGRCIESDCNGIGTGRTYLTFDAYELTNQATKASVLSATVGVTQIHNYSQCTSTPVDLWSSNGRFTSTTTWPGNSVGKLATASSGASDSCAGTQQGRVEFTSDDLDMYVQASVNGGNRWMNFALRSPDENNGYQWKRFASGGAGVPTLEVVYGFPPSDITATGVLSQTSACSSGNTVYTNSNDVTVGGSARSNGPTRPGVVFTFVLYRTGSSTPYAQSPAYGVEGTSAVRTWSYTFQNLPDGQYWYRVRARSAVADGALFGAVTSASDSSFTVDTTPPTTAPTLATYDFPEDFWGRPSGGVFTIGSNGDPTIVGYAFSAISASQIPDPQSASCSFSAPGLIRATGSATTWAPDLPAGRHTLYVRSFDATGQLSGDVRTRTVLIARNYNTGYRYEAENMTSVARTFNGVSPSSTIYDRSVDSTSNDMVAQLLATAGNSSNGPEFEFVVNASVEADYAFAAGLLRGNHFGVLQFGIKAPGQSRPTWIKDPNTQQVLTFNGYASGTSKAFLPLGALHLPVGNSIFVVKVIGKDAASVNYADSATGATVNDNGYSGAIDYFIAVPVTRVTMDSIATARNNDGVGASGTRTADITMSSSQQSIATSALLNMGEYDRTAKTLTTGGVIFQMPDEATYDSDRDNVVAIGQSIKISGSARPLKRVEVLATATCGQLTASALSQFSVNFVDTTAYPENKILPTTPNWTTSGVTDAALAANDIDTGIGEKITIRTGGSQLYFNNNGTNDLTRANFYRITIPIANKALPVASLTLPYTGTSLTGGCDKALHVFAITYVS